MDRPPLVLCPYDAELFGHWWYEGPEFLDHFVRKACSAESALKLITPGDYLRLQPTNQVSTPSTSSWGEGGYFGVWLNPGNEWIYRELSMAQQRMSELAQRFVQPDSLTQRALMQAGRELLLAQASDWPFILRTGTSPDYARKRVKEHLARFSTLYEQTINSQVDIAWLTAIEHQDNIFPEINYEYWGKGDDKS
jgi:1,4-alpha-glucan branching enzyme